MSKTASPGQGDHGILGQKGILEASTQKEKFLQQISYKLKQQRYLHNLSCPIPAAFVLLIAMNEVTEMATTRRLGSNLIIKK